MEVIRGIHNVRARHHGCVVTIGNFDGVHRGHQMLLQHLIERAQDHKVPSVLITFEPQPREFFRGESVPARLTRFREKVTLLRDTGLDRVLCLPFNESLASIKPRRLLEDLLVERLGVKYVVVGDDFRFGRNAGGDFSMIEAAAEELGFEAQRMSTLNAADERISSSRIRQLLGEGKLDEAAVLLGHSYFIMGRVVYGRQLGRQLGTPTANIKLQRYHSAIRGVFAVEVESEREGLRLNGVANIGVRPTVEGQEPLLEVHLFDWSGNLYGDLLTVKFVEKLREEQKFESLEALKEQIAIDIEMSKSVLEQTNTRGEV